MPKNKVEKYQEEELDYTEEVEEDVELILPKQGPLIGPSPAATPSPTPEYIPIQQEIVPLQQQLPVVQKPVRRVMSASRNQAPSQTPIQALEQAALEVTNRIPAEDIQHLRNQLADPCVLQALLEQMPSSAKVAKKESISLQILLHTHLTTMKRHNEEESAITQDLKKIRERIHKDFTRRDALSDNVKETVRETAASLLAHVNRGQEKLSTDFCEALADIQDKNKVKEDEMLEGIRKGIADGKRTYIYLREMKGTADATASQAQMDMQQLHRQLENISNMQNQLMALVQAQQNLARQPQVILGERTCMFCKSNFHESKDCMRYRTAADRKNLAYQQGICPQCLTDFRHATCPNEDRVAIPCAYCLERNLPRADRHLEMFCPIQFGGDPSVLLPAENGSNNHPGSRKRNGSPGGRGGRAGGQRGGYRGGRGKFQRQDNGAPAPVQNNT